MKKKVFAISGSTRSSSSNLQIIVAIQKLFADELEIEIYPSINLLPHFNPDDDKEDSVPIAVAEFRNKIKNADGVLICTPEYVFSLPGSLKNAIEWTVGTVIFSEKPLALITASGLGEKAHEALQLIMKTIYGNFTPETQLHISGARTKVNDDGFTNQDIALQIKNVIDAFIKLIDANHS